MVFRGAGFRIALIVLTAVVLSSFLSFSAILITPASAQLDELGGLDCQALTGTQGWLGQYYNYNSTHPDMELPFELWNVSHGDPLGEWTADWYTDRYYRFTRIDGAINFGGMFFPFDAAPEELTMGHEFHYGVHWRGIVDSSSGTYRYVFASDDDGWVYVNGRLNFSFPGIHPATGRIGTIDLKKWDIVDVFYAERRTSYSYINFTLSPSPAMLPYSGECGMCGNGIVDGAEECDDGNTANGDGCSSTCVFETSACLPDNLPMTIVSDPETLANGLPSVEAWAGPRWTANIPGATWISATYLIGDPENDSEINFTRSFTLPSNANFLNGSVQIAADNSYSCSLNGYLVGKSDSELNYDEESKRTYQLEEKLRPGTNTFLCNVKNWAMMYGTPQLNPTGILYKMEISGFCIAACGNGFVDGNENCEPPGTANSAYCPQVTNECLGKKTGARDSYGTCSPSCGCEYDGYAYSCVKGLCGAECAIDSDCSSSCAGGVRYFGGSCAQGDCSCSYSSENCDSNDGWYDTAQTQWVSSGVCKMKQQIYQNYRDYSCAPEACAFIVTDNRWIDTGQTGNSEDGTTCDDGLFCTVNDQCGNGICAGSPNTCSDENESTVDTCLEQTSSCMHTTFNPTDSDGDGVPDSIDSCPAVFGTACNGCPNPCSGCAAMVCGEGAPTCASNDSVCLPARCPRNGCGLGSCLSVQFATYPTVMNNTCNVLTYNGTCTQNACIPVCTENGICNPVAPPSGGGGGGGSGAYCGDGIVQKWTGEECEKNSDCQPGFECNESCACAATCHPNCNAVNESNSSASGSSGNMDKNEFTYPNPQVLDRVINVSMQNCGDGTCDENEWETCESCPSDCKCAPPAGYGITNGITGFVTGSQGLDFEGLASSAIRAYLLFAFKSLNIFL